LLYYTGRIKDKHVVRGKDGVGAKTDNMEGKVLRFKVPPPFVDGRIHTLTSLVRTFIDGCVLDGDFLFFFLSLAGSIPC
jgi:hypothetical protein